MHKTILPLLVVIFIQFHSGCMSGETAVPAAINELPTTADLAGKWKSEHGFYIIFDDESGTFSGSNDEQAAAAELGILGTFALVGDQLSLVEHDDSDSCPGVVGQFEAVITADDKLRLSIIEDPCIYRVEGLFQGGQGGYRLLEFRRIKD